MIRYLSGAQVIEPHDLSIIKHGGLAGIRDIGLVDSSVHQPLAMFGGVDLYSTLEEKAAALCFSLVINHGFLDGNKRVGFAALDVLLRLNDVSLIAGTDEAELIILELASGALTRDEFTEWVQQHVIPRTGGVHGP